eukprot:TRINITY_DN2785_c0_g1_i1.p1 TRINITY_DN2785_c0_g1~~TRINITY_DN2785_c0_g1_i1.p1  ORF type:complete len:250 (-),score=33.62 TRINITY_DN2785_c0_g1_i1:255-1004(-)
MATQTLQSTSSGFSVEQIKVGVETWIKSQNPVVEVLATATMSAGQGGLLGYVMGTISKSAMNMSPAGQSPEVNKQMQMMHKGGPLVQARNFAVLLGVQSGLSLALKKARKGKDDIYNTVIAAAGGGAAFALVSGIPEQALFMAAAFGGFQGLFSWLGNRMKPETKDDQYKQASYLFESLGLGKYSGKLKKGRLTDDTIMLWNNEALQEVGVPVGARLLVMHHLQQMKSKTGSNQYVPHAPIPPPQQRLQ